MTTPTRMSAGCGCAVAACLGLLCVPVLLFGAGGGDPKGAAAAPMPGWQAAPGSDVVMLWGGSCAAPVGCQRIPAELPWVPAGFYPDRYDDPPGECTSWAAALWPGHRGGGVTWGGDAWEWYANAAAQGYAVSQLPTIGAIAVFGRTGSSGGEWGHVAVVIGVGAGAFRVTEMNRDARFLVDERSVSLGDPGLTGFIPVPADAVSSTAGAAP